MCFHRQGLSDSLQSDVRSAFPTQFYSALALKTGFSQSLAKGQGGERRSWEEIQDLPTGKASGSLCASVRWQASVSKYLIPTASTY